MIDSLPSILPQLPEPIMSDTIVVPVDTAYIFPIETDTLNIEEEIYVEEDSFTLEHPADLLIEEIEKVLPAGTDVYSQPIEEHVVTSMREAAYIPPQFADTLVSDTVSLPVDNAYYSYIEEVSYGLDGDSIPSMANNEGWVFGLLTGLFFIFIFASRLSPGLIAEEVRSIFKVKERASIFSSLTLNNYRFRYIYVFFALCVFSLYCYFVLYDPAVNDFSFVKYLKFLLVFVSFFVVKLLLAEILGYVFSDGKTMNIAKKSYFSFITLLGIILYPLLVISIYSPMEINYLVQYIALGACVLIAIFVILKLFQIFFRKSLDIFYILLYLCTLEILPVLALLQVFHCIN